MITLGIETSCDDTAFALLKDSKEVLSSVISSQVSIHQTFGGVVPEIAARRHLEVLQPLFVKTLTDASVSVAEIDQIAVTQGPGLIGGVLVGAAFARGLAQYKNCPLIPVNHVKAHIYGALLGVTGAWQDVFPALALVVSGGHTHLYYLKQAGSFDLLLESGDDACGECFDKVGKMLGLDYPSGKYIENLAHKGNPNAFKMPKVVTTKSQSEFSYSGLKTHMFYLINKLRKSGELEDEQILADLCASFQQAAFEQIIRKTNYIYSTMQNSVASLLVGGGVAANKTLISTLHSQLSSLSIHAAPIEYCSDNGAMIAACGADIYDSSKNKSIYKPNTPWSPYSRYHNE